MTAGVHDQSSVGIPLYGTINDQPFLTLGFLSEDEDRDQIAGTSGTVIDCLQSKFCAFEDILSRIRAAEMQGVMGNILGRGVCLGENIGRVRSCFTADLGRTEVKGAALSK